jgi:hypothetical protein
MAAGYTHACSAGGWNFTGTVQYHNFASGKIFDFWTLGYQSSNPVGLEYHVRAWDSNQNNLVYDTNYIYNTSINHASSSPNLYMNNGLRFLLQAGRTGDGYATCTLMDLYVG